MIGFGAESFFALAVLVALLAAGIVLLARWRSRARRAFAGPRSRSWPSVAFWPRSLFLLAAAVLIVLAAARPQWGSDRLTREFEGIDMVIVLDISLSMTADDVSPSRLRVAQDNLATLVEAQRGSRFGLVLFAGSPFLRSPLSTDSQAMIGLIRRAEGELGLTRAGSDLGAALELGGAVLAASENSGRAIVLVSDGEDHAGSYTEQAEALAEQGITLFTVGVGTAEGGRIYEENPIGQRFPIFDANGAVISRLDEASLRTIAEAGGGSYTHLDGGSTTAMLALRNDFARLDQTPIGAQTQEVPIERFQWFVAAALVLLLLSWFTPSRLPLPSLRWLRRRGRRPALAALILAALIGGCSEDPLRARNEAANEHYAAGNHQEALDGYQSLVRERPDIDEFSYNAGNALHRLGAFERAVAETQRALPPVDPVLGARTYYALGNHLLALERLEEAYIAYRNALLLEPGDSDAKHNLEYVLLLADLRDNPPDPAEAPEGPGPGPDGGTPAPGEGEQPGEGTPEPGETGEPGEGDGEGEGEEGEPTPGPGEGSPGPGEGEPGEGLSEEALQRLLEEALAGMSEEITYEEAIGILDLLRRQQQRQLPQPGAGSGPAW